MKHRDFYEINLFSPTSSEGQLLISFIAKQDWHQLDQWAFSQTADSGMINQTLKNFVQFEKIEHIISLRDALDPDQEEGIWHDDGSRLMAFTLSLTTEFIEGGLLCLRKKGEINFNTISTRPFGTLLIFKTGVEGLEHKVTKVTSGKRLVIAGWCS